MSKEKSYSKIFSESPTSPFEKGYGYWDVSRFPYGNDFKRFKGNEEISEVLYGPVKYKNRELRVKLNTGQTIVVNRDGFLDKNYADSLINEYNR